MTDELIPTTPTPSLTRRSVLGALGAVPLAASGVLGATAAGPVAGPAATRSARIPRDLRPGGALDRHVADLAEQDRFSGSILLTHRGRTVLERSHGLANKAEGIPNGPDTRFRLASVTKLSTAIAVNRLVQEDSVRYGEPLGAYLDGFPAEIADHVTVHHLLTHTSGLGDFHDLPGYTDAVHTWDSAAEVFDGTMEFIRGSQLDFPPGAGWRYSNAAYCILGAIVAAVSGRPYYDYVADHVFAAAEMTGSAFVTKPEWIDDHTVARPYHRPEGSTEWVENLDFFPYIGLPAGNSFATCKDLDRFARALLDDDLLDSPFTQLTLGPKVPITGPRRPPGAEPPSGPPRMGFMGYGPIVTLLGDQWSFGHAGGSRAGDAAAVYAYPDSGWVTVFLSNYDAPLAELMDLSSQLIVGDA